MKVIFLDIDGVLNCEEAYRAGECKYQEWTWEDGRKDHHQKFCSWSKEWLNKLIEETDAKIVISSTWRMSGIEFMKKVWELEEMKGEIIGITPMLWAKGVDKGMSIPRGLEIDHYLENDLKFRHINWDRDEQDSVIKESGVENYIIIDDDSDMLYEQRHHFIHVLPSPRNKRGFDRAHYVHAIGVLGLTVSDITYRENC